MKKNNSFEIKLNKLSKGVLFSAFTMCFCVILITFILAGCQSGEGSNSATENSSATSTVPSPEQIDEEKYTFSDGIFIGKADISNKTFKEAREIANTEIETLIKDFDITVVIGEDKHSLNRESFEFDNNIEKLLLDAKLYNDKKASSENKENTSKTFDLTFEVSKASVDTEVKKLAELTDCEPVNASIGGIKNGKATITKGTDGKKLNQEKLTNEITAAVNALAKGEEAKNEITAEVESIKPDVTHTELNGKITRLSSFHTVSTNTADGNHNMKLALDSCNGSVILPGEVWSFNACTGNSNLTSLGYRPATVIIGGELVPGIGGGLCQSSTTIYNAAIRTNMEIVERYCHYFQSTYAPAGLDATIDYPNLDLKLKNPTEYPMYMECYMEGVTLYCNIYGYQDPSFDKVVVDSYIYDANPNENYYRAGATRTFYKNGKVVLEEQLHSSTYHYKSPSENTSSSSTAEPTKPSNKPTAKPTTPAPTNPNTTQKPVTQPTTKPVITPPSSEVTVPITPPAPVVTTPTQPIEY